MKIRLGKYDKLWSKICRDKTPYCQNCGKKNALNAHHIMPRSRKGTRLLVENCLVLCAGCHVFNPDSVHRSPEGSKKFCVRIIGLKEYKKLEKLSLKTVTEREAIKEFINKYKI